MPDVLRLRAPDGAEGVLLATACAACGAVALGTRQRCLNCTNDQVKLRECSSKGTLSNYTVVSRAAESWTGRTPYALGQVALPEGLIVTAEIVGTPFDSLVVGMPMRLTLEVVGHNSSGHPMLVYKWTSTPV